MVLPTPCSSGACKGVLLYHSTWKQLTNRGCNYLTTCMQLTAYMQLTTWMQLTNHMDATV